MEISLYVSDWFHSCLQLSGSLVLAVGLWLRFDPDTANLLAESDAPEHFFIGELEKNVKALIKCFHNSFCRFHKHVQT